MYRIHASGSSSLRHPALQRYRFHEGVSGTLPAEGHAAGSEMGVLPEGPRGAMIGSFHRGRGCRLVLWLICLWCATRRAETAPLATFQYRIVGAQLRATPVAVSVPKGIAGSVLVQ